LILSVGSESLENMINSNKLYLWDLLLNKATSSKKFQKTRAAYAILEKIEFGLIIF
jgi:hypothetical protein